MIKVIAAPTGKRQAAAVVTRISGALGIGAMVFVQSMTTRREVLRLSVPLLPAQQVREPRGQVLWRAPFTADGLFPQTHLHKETRSLVSCGSFLA